MEEEKFMRLALAEAIKAARRGEVPVGAVVVSKNRVLSRGHNEPVRRDDPTAHAEILAMRKASRKLKNYRLLDCDLYVTIEPCVMCLGAAIQARVRKIIYGAADPKAGAIESTMSFPFGRLNHRPEVKAGVLAQECGALLQRFFARKRKKSMP
ncbi:MAG: tRNA adenosine(34) deaminase TadA [Candidatus Aminicenantales bacterium]